MLAATEEPAVGTTVPVTVGTILRRYLVTDGAARRRWQRYATRASRGVVNQAAVSMVLAQWLWEHGEVADSDVLLPRRLKDRVSRALSGERISPQTLRVFIEAFQIPEAVADELWDAHLHIDLTLEGAL